MPSPIRLTEHIQDWRPADLLVDHERGLVRNVALTGLTSKNGYRYSEQALRDALPLYNAKPVFLDHAPNTTRPFDRSTRDLVGSVVNARFEHSRVRGDIQVLDTEAGRTFLALAEAGSAAVGMSHVVLAHRSADQSTVERIHEVISVDAVTFPATTATLREHTASSTATATTTGKRGASAVADPAGRLDPTGDCHLLQSENQALSRQLAELRSELDQLRLIHCATILEQEIADLLRESRLPAHAVTDHFRQQLVQAPDRATRRQFIEDRRQLVASLARRAPASRPRLASEEGAFDTALMTALKRRH